MKANTIFSRASYATDNIIFFDIKRERDLFFLYGIKYLTNKVQLIKLPHSYISGTNKPQFFCFTKNNVVIDVDVTKSVLNTNTCVLYFSSKVVDSVKLYKTKNNIYSTNINDAGFSFFRNSHNDQIIVPVEQLVTDGLVFPVTSEFSYNDFLDYN